MSAVKPKISRGQSISDMSFVDPDWVKDPMPPWIGLLGRLEIKEAIRLTKVDIDFQIEVAKLQMEFSRKKIAYIQRVQKTLGAK